MNKTNDLIFNKEENSLTLSDEALEQAYIDNEDNIEHILSEFGLDKRSQKVNKIFNDFLSELDSLFERIK